MPLKQTVTLLSLLFATTVGAEEIREDAVVCHLDLAPHAALIVSGDMIVMPGADEPKAFSCQSADLNDDGGVGIIDLGLCNKDYENEDSEVCQMVVTYYWGKICATKE